MNISALPTRPKCPRTGRDFTYAFYVFYFAQVRYGASGMQGWRKSMEDAHIAHVDVIPGEVSIFGVFDGHGG